ncbi:MAG: hypothetical protein ACREMF_02025 [Gemmatimonadales bacterium]
MWDKLIDAVVKALATAITGGGLALLGGMGRLFGQLVLSAYAGALSLSFLDERPITGALYGTWARGIMLRPLGQSFTIAAGGVLLLLLMLIAHVLFKPSLATAHEQRVHPGLARFYVRFYFPLTIVALLVMIAVLAVVTSPFWLVALFVLLAVPATVYAICFSRDLVRGAFWARLCYASYLLSFVVALLLLPHRYGRDQFDLRLRTVSEIAGVPTNGNVFVFDERDTVLCTVTPVEGGLNVRLHKPTDGFSPAGERVTSLRRWAQLYATSAPVDTGGVRDSVRSMINRL